MVNFAQADRRDGRRSCMAVPMLARWTDDKEHEVKIHSRDISDGGIFFHANSEIAIGTEVEVTFTLPSDPGASGNKRFCVQGTVIRAERDSEKTGYALRITSSELLETDDTVAQARQAVRRLAANNSSRTLIWERRHRLLFLACSGLAVLIVLTAVGPFIARAGGAAGAVAAIRRIAAGIRATQDAPSPDAPESKVEHKRKIVRTARVAEAREKKAVSNHVEPEAIDWAPDASTVQSPSPARDSTAQSPAVAFGHNNLLTLDIQKGKPVSPLGYIGELPAPATNSGLSGSLTGSRAKTNAAAAIPSPTAVVLRIVVGRDGRVQDVQRASGPAELSPASLAAIRHWKFRPDPGGPRHREIYVTLNFTSYPE